MYLRRHRRTTAGQTYEYWTLVESRRTANGPRQHTVATLGKLPGLDRQVEPGWESLDGRVSVLTNDTKQGLRFFTQQV
jgi:hypothetical protein